MAVVDEHGPLAGAVFAPVTDELFSAARGAGATLNGAPIRCSAASELATALVATGFNYSPTTRERQADRLASLLPRVRDVRRFGSAALDLCFVASGRLDAYFEEHLNSWDLAAGVLIAAEAGARHVELLRRAGRHRRRGRRGPAGAPGTRRADRRRSTPQHPTPERHFTSSGRPWSPLASAMRHHGGVGTRILAVEDDERIRSAVKLALEDEGWIVDEAESGEEAIEKFARSNPDVVLIDIMLPGIDGFELCRTLRRTSDVPVVMVTARNDTHDVVAGLEAGADDYLTKPFAPKELSARIRALLRRIRPSAQGHARLSSATSN